MKPTQMDKDNLFKALSSRRFKLAKILIEGGMDIDAKDENGVTPLMKICHMNIKEKIKLDLVEVLLKNDVDLHTTDTAGRTALMYAIHSGAVCVVQLLKRHGLTESVKTTIRLSRTSQINIWESFET